MSGFFTSHCEKLGLLLEDSKVELAAPFDEAVARMKAAVAEGSMIFAFGNGGSASDASHFVAEFTGRFRRERRGLPAISLSAETAAVTAIGNDYGFEQIFSRQIEALGTEGDIAVALTTSGKSKNVLAALVKAQGMGMKTLALTGRAGLVGGKADVVLAVPSSETYLVQEVHKVILHSLCEEVERGVAGEGK